jgi:hypothetical protein
VTLEKDHTLSLSLMLIDQMRRGKGYYDDHKTSVEAMTYWITTNDMSVAWDIINAIEIGLEKRDEIIAITDKKDDEHISYDIIQSIFPIQMMRSTGMGQDAVYNNLTGSFKYWNAIRLFKLPTIMFAYTDSMRATLLASIKKLKKKKDASRYDIKDEFDNLIVLFTDELNKYAMSSPFVKPENFPSYISARTDRDNSKVTLTESQFEAKDLFGKVSEISVLWDAIDSSMRSFDSLPIQAKRSIMAGQNKTPVKAEVLVSLGLATDDKIRQMEINGQINELFKPVLRVINVLREIETTFLKARGMSIDDLPMLVEKQNADYDAITDRIKSLELSRQKLVNRFKKISEQRKDVTIDQIVASFAKTNTYLDKKLLPQNKD